MINHESIRGQTPHSRPVNVVVAPDQGGTRHVLLIRNQRDRRWTLPSEVLDYLPPKEWEVRLDMLAESGIEVASIPSAELTGDAPDSSPNTSAALKILPYKPAAVTRADSEVTWMPLGEAARCQSAPHSWYADHHDAVRTAYRRFEQFEASMKTAQTNHQNGSLGGAVYGWGIAASILPDPMSRGRALRGMAVSLNQLEDPRAEDTAQRALALHQTYIDKLPAHERYTTARELIESHAVIGRIMLWPIVEAERTYQLARIDADAAAQKPLDHFNKAFDYAEEVRRAVAAAAEASTNSPQPDQHRINLLSRYVLAHSLYGDRARAREVSLEALDVVLQSKAAGRGADRSADYHNKARRAAAAQAVTAWTVSHLLVRLGFPGRRAALNLAVLRAGL